MNSKSFAFRIMAWLTASLFYSYSLAVISAFQNAAIDIQQGLSISNSLFASIISANLISYSLMQIPVGILLDHYSLKKLSSYAISIFSACCILLGLTDSYWVVITARIIMGITAAFGVLGAFKISSEWFDSKQFATLAGLTVSLGMLGATYGNSHMQVITELYNYKVWFTYAGVFGLILTASSILFISNKHPPIGDIKSLSDIKYDIQSVLCNKSSMILILYAMLMYTPFLIFKDTFGNSFLEAHYNLARVDASSLINQILFASLLAAPLLGIISDHMGRRLPLLKICTISTLVLLGLLLSKLTQPGVTVFLFGFSSWGFLITYTIFKETHSPKIVSTGLGVMNSLNMLGGVILSPLIGVVIDKAPEVVNAINENNVFTYAFVLLPIVISLSLPLLWRIPETHCQQIIK
ncbi:MFS transporter [Gammaproteobacteria bacterium]|nr:MFS transporter [Gammaproteobacteria bacterium]